MTERFVLVLTEELSLVVTNSDCLTKTNANLHHFNGKYLGLKYLFL